MNGTILPDSEQNPPGSAIGRNIGCSGQHAPNPATAGSGKIQGPAEHILLKKACRRATGPARKCRVRSKCRQKLVRGAIGPLYRDQVITVVAGAEIRAGQNSITWSSQRRWSASTMAICGRAGAGDLSPEGLGDLYGEPSPPTDRRPQEIITCFPAWSWPRCRQAPARAPNRSRATVRRPERRSVRA